jgi:hypothetical protein
MQIKIVFVKVTGKDHLGSCACMGAGCNVRIFLKRICGEDVISVHLAQARISLSGMENLLLCSSNSTTG